MFGDVWLCSGQSNMEMAFQYIVNSTEEMEASADFNIRYTVMEPTTDLGEVDDFRFVKQNSRQFFNFYLFRDIAVSVPWSLPSDSKALR